MPTLSLKQLLIQDFNITITQQQTDALVRYCALYEIRSDHVLAFNTPLLGVTKAYFLPKDSDAIYEIFKISKSDFVRTVRKCVGINKAYHVSGNDFNLLIVYLIYCYNISALPKDKKHLGMLTLAKMLHYKFFTGKVNHSFPHGAKEGVMQYTIDNLSAKCDIKKPETPTWKALINDHCIRVLAADSIHVKTLETFSPDEKIVYILSDLHTRISTKIVNVASEYYANNAAGKDITSVSAVMVDGDGEKELRTMRATLDNTIISLQNAVLNTTVFISHSDVKLAANIANVRPDMLRSVLTTFSSLATEQYRQHTTEEIAYDKQKEKLYIGYRILITELLQKTYRRAVQCGCNMRSNVEILERTRDAFRASRILDPDILIIKNSVQYFIETNTSYTREATIIALRMGLVMYLMIQSFKQ